MIDDGSTDDTAARRRALRRSRRPLREPAAWRRGAGSQHRPRVTSAPLVAFLDADDTWLPDRVEAGVAHLARHPELALVAAHAFACDEGLRPTAVVPAATRETGPHARAAARRQRRPESQLRARSGERPSRRRVASARSRSERTGTPGSRSRSAFRSGSSTGRSRSCGATPGSVSPRRGPTSTSTARSSSPTSRPTGPPGSGRSSGGGERRWRYFHAGLAARRAATGAVARRHAITVDRAGPRYAGAPKGQAPDARVPAGVGWRRVRAPRGVVRDLGRRAFTGFLWAAASYAGGRILFFAATLVLARLLVPDEFGLVAFVLAVIHYLEYLTDLGLGAALVYRSDAEDPRVSSTAFWIGICGGLVLFALCWVAAPLLGEIGPDDEVVPLFRVLALYFLFTALGKAHEYLLRRNARVPEAVLAAAPRRADQGRGQHRARLGGGRGVEPDHRPAGRRPVPVGGALDRLPLAAELRHLTHPPPADAELRPGHRGRRRAGSGRRQLRLPRRGSQAGRGRARRLLPRVPAAGARDPVGLPGGQRRPVPVLRAPQGRATSTAPTSCGAAIWRPSGWGRWSRSRRRSGWRRWPCRWS